MAMDNVILIKIISAMLYPIGLAVLLLVFGLMAKLGKLYRTMLLCWVSSFLLILIFSNPLVAQSLAASLERQYPPTAMADIAPHDAIIVLGGGLRLPISPALQTQISAGSDRYWYAVQLFRESKAAKIVLTGGNVYPQPGYQGEAYYAAKLLQEWGVPATAIMIESESRTTLQNKHNTAELLAAEQIHSALLLTSALHMPRAYRLFEDLPVRLTPVSADILVQDIDTPGIFNWLPSAAALSLSTRALHEYYGICFVELNALMTSS